MTSTHNFPAVLGALVSAAVAVVSAVPVAPAQGSRIEPLRRSARVESNLVVTRFLLASALGDRRAACALFPTHRPCRRGDRFVGPADFELVGITLADPEHPAVHAKVGGVGGSFLLARAGGSFVIVKAGQALARGLLERPTQESQRRPVGRSARADANLVVSRFLLAVAMGDRRTACAMFPTYLQCQEGHKLEGPADFKVVGVTLADPAHPAVFANVGGIRGYFVLERARSSFVIVTAAAD